MGKRQKGKRDATGTNIFVDEFGTVSFTKSTFRDGIRKLKPGAAPSPQNNVEDIKPKYQTLPQEIPEAKPAGFINFSNTFIQEPIAKLREPVLPVFAQEKPDTSTRDITTFSPFVDVHKEFLNINCDIRCSICSVELRSKNLVRHMSTVHGKGMATSTPSISPSRPRGRSKQSRNTASPQQSSPQQHQQNDAFRQNEQESRYGGKHLGQMRREFNGRFGSMPLYDDYSDEAHAD